MISWVIEDPHRQKQSVSSWFLTVGQFRKFQNQKNLSKFADPTASSGAVEPRFVEACAKKARRAFSTHNRTYLCPGWCDKPLPSPTGDITLTSPQ